ncbi:MAG: bifunctional hydroxymethylpyrimidine kinase/phosphomethylpyrimidine kinase, partial [Betaproteobacteria bacterium]|nr:bifunctional hydroxymethylpyrimidine kinase/phosphomethylpyrimidine kinase [Betaproteobacteria bacterium]
MYMKTPPAVLIFSAVDGTGGAGAFADNRAIAAAGCIPLSIITAVTAQNLDGVLACWRLPPQKIRAQFAALKNAPIRAVKIGVLHAAEAAAECIDSLGGKIPVVWDPVLAPTFGAPFA